MTLRLGDSGQQVRDWQMTLAGRGYSIAVDGVFGPRTHNATMAWQAAHGIETTGEVGMNELQILAAPPTRSVRPPPMLAHSIPFIEAKHHGRAARALVDLIVLHCMEAPEASTRAEACAEYFAMGPVVASAHYCADSDSVVQCVPDHLVAYGAPGANHNGLHIELAGYARQARDAWLDDFGIRMLWMAAQLVARKCSEWNIPVLFLRADQLLGPRPRGITTHYEVSQAFKQSSHTDPGPGFPMDYFLEQVDVALDAQQDDIA